MWYNSLSIPFAFILNECKHTLHSEYECNYKQLANLIFCSIMSNLLGALTGFATHKRETRANITIHPISVIRKANNLFSPTLP